MDEITLVAQTKRGEAARAFAPAAGEKKALVAVELPEAPFFRAVMAPVRAEGGSFAIAEGAWNVLGLRAGSPVIVLPIE
jgi:arginine N-succinyltransferase